MVLSVLPRSVSHGGLSHRAQRHLNKFHLCVTPQPSARSASAAILSFPGKDPSLEIKYRPKKNKEKKEAEPEREEKSDRDESSTPPPKIDRRRGSQVGERPGACHRCTDRRTGVSRRGRVQARWVLMRCGSGPDQALGQDVRRVRRLSEDGGLRSVRLLQRHEEVRRAQQDSTEVSAQAVRGPSPGERLHSRTPPRRHGDVT